MGPPATGPPGRLELDGPARADAEAVGGLVPGVGDGAADGARDAGGRVAVGVVVGAGVGAGDLVGAGVEGGAVRMGVGAGVVTGGVGVGFGFAVGRAVGLAWRTGGAPGTGEAIEPKAIAGTARLAIARPAMSVARDLVRLVASMAGCEGTMHLRPRDCR